MFQPVIKWIGVKRRQSDDILKYFPSEIDTYYEPFLGSGSVMRALMDSNIKVKHYVCTDLCKDLIDLWNMIKNRPEDLIASYEDRWNEMMMHDDEHIDERQKVYYDIRSRYNLYKDEDEHVFDFFYLLRACFNGLPRWNTKTNGFNSPFSVTRKSINPDRMASIIREWSYVLNEHDVEFRCCSFDTINPKEGDYVYMDPPYAKTNAKGAYVGGVEPELFFEFLRSLQKNKVKYSFSYDGKSGSIDYTYDVPRDVYDVHEYIKSAQSGFRKMKRIEKELDVFDSLYVKN